MRGVSNCRFLCAETNRTIAVTSALSLQDTCLLLAQSGHSRRAADAPLLRRCAGRQRHRHIGTVFELDSHEDHLVIADIFQIVNCEFALA